MLKICRNENKFVPENIVCISSICNGIWATQDYLILSHTIIKRVAPFCPFMYQVMLTLNL